MGFERQRVIGDIPFASEGDSTRALADTIQGFTNWGFKKHEQQRVISGQEEAQQVKPGVEAPELKSKMTSHGQAYNRIVQQGHMAAVKNDYTNNFAQLHSEISARNGDPQEFYESAKAYKNKTLNDVSPEHRQAFSLDMDAAINHYGSNLTQSAMKQAEEASLIEVVSSAGAMIEDGGRYAFDGNLNDVAQSRDFFYSTVVKELEEAGQAKQAAVLKDKFEETIDRELTLGQADKAIQSGGGDQYLREFMKNPPKDLSREQIENYTSTMFTMNNKYKSVQTQEGAVNKIELGRAISDMEIAIHNGQGDFKEVDKFFELGYISHKDRTRMYKAINKGYDKEQEKAKLYSDIAEELVSDNPIIRSPKELTDHYENVIVPSQAGMTPELVDQQNAQFINKTKFVPTPLKQALNAFALSDNPDHIIRAAKIADIIDKTPGLVESTFDARTEALVTTTAELMTSLSGPEAVTKAKELTDPRNEAMIESRKAAIKEDKTNYEDKISDHFNSFFSTKIDDLNRSQLASEYKKNYEALYLSGMQKDSAEKSAIKKLERNWSEFNGRIMQYSPDDYYSVGGDTGYISEQLIKDVKKDFWTAGEPIRKKDIILYSDEATARTASTGSPKYRIAVMQDGSFSYIPGYWKPDVEKEVKRVKAKNLKIMQGLEKEDGPETLDFLNMEGKF